MNFYNKQHKYYCGIDLHGRTMYICIMNSAGKRLLHRNIRNDAGYFLKLIAPYREDIVVAVECVFAWYWLADLCSKEGIPFVLGHALYMKAVHGGKAKNDKIDSEKITKLTRGGVLPIAYVYPSKMRSARDLMRRRLYFVRKRAELIVHIQLSRMQYNLASFSQEVKSGRSKTHSGIKEHFPDHFVQKSIAADLETIEHYNQMIKRLEKDIFKGGLSHDPDVLCILQTIHGIGKILALTILYEIYTIERFPRVQDFLSYALLVKSSKQSAGKNLGTCGKHMGNHHLKWAFSEAAVKFLAGDERGQAYREKLQKKYGKAKGLTILAAKLGRVVYVMLKNKRSFDIEKFLKN